ncbi:hypothetical protein [Acetobacter aceti]|uniref:CHAD domain-containing protein n=1 Tax=Acetobacter aceti TaxID=435 RepID=A0A6S6PEG8_ACEAC|nr:hypothetical protein [Acetobacter aceti]BCI65643.1 hypothetical protein AAJCM20276_02670 [Acetobacter aceti]
MVTEATARFSDQQLNRLFEAILVNDVAKDHVTLPETIPASFTDDVVRDCFEISHELWARQVDRRILVALVDHLVLSADLNSRERVNFKHIRAKFKHMRFACVLYTTRHQSPILFKSMTTLMGHVQDAFRNGHSLKTRLYALALRIMIISPCWRMMERELSRMKQETGAAFEEYLRKQISTLSDSLHADRMTAHHFHALRKIISRQVSFFDDYRTIFPDNRSDTMARYLSDLNGRMGRMHDDLVLQHAQGKQDYHKCQFTLDTALREKLNGLVHQYPMRRE